VPVNKVNKDTRKETAASDISALRYGAQPLVRRTVRRAMTRDFSWAAAARRYLALYRGLQPAPAA
jgi:glycogen synthase